MTSLASEACSRRFGKAGGSISAQLGNPQRARAATWQLVNVGGPFADRAKKGTGSDPARNPASVPKASPCRSKCCCSPMIL